MPQHTVEALGQCDGTAIPLIFTDPDKRIVVFGSHLRRLPPDGSILYSLYPADH